MSLQSVVASPGMLPVALSSNGLTIRWRDVGRCPFTEASFDWSLASWEAEHGAGLSARSALSCLDRPDPGIGGIEPTVFIFHMSRCGSTLLARALAQSPQVICMSEVLALNELLLHLTGGDLGRQPPDARSTRILRNFILALGRRRTVAHRYFAVKFSSWNVMLLRSLQAAFPRVPCLFLYRDPAEVIVSLLRAPAGPSSARAGAFPGRRATLRSGELLRVIGKYLRDLMLAGLGSGGVDYLNYTHLTPALLPRLLRHLGVQVGVDELAAMTAQFGVYAKARKGHAPFEPDSREKQRAVTEEIRAAAAFVAAPYRALEASGRNLRAILDIRA